MFGMKFGKKAKSLRIFPSFVGYRRRWLRHDVMAALVVTAIAIPESLGFAIIVGLPVQAGLYCAILAPIVFAAFTSSRRLVVGADSATAALVAAGAASVAAVGTAAYSDAIGALGVLTALVLLVMALLRFGFLADLISRPVLVGFISGVGVQLIIGKLPEMLGLHAHGTIVDKLVFTVTHLGNAAWPTVILSLCVVAIVVAGWRWKYPGALLALLLVICSTMVFGLEKVGIEVVGAVSPGLPHLAVPQMSLPLISQLLPAAISIAIVILAQSLAVIRSSAAKHEEKVNDNQDLMALGLANASSALIGGFAINGSPPRTTAGEMAGGRSQLVNVIMALLVASVLLFATGLFRYVPSASLAAIVFTIGIHLFKYTELRDIWRVRKSEFVIAAIALVAVATLGVRQGVILAVLISLVERLRQQYHPKSEVLVRDQQYAEWAADRFAKGRHPIDAPPGLLVYRFNDALFFENAGYFHDSVTKLVAGTKSPVKVFVVEASAITDIDYTAARVIGRLVAQLNADDIQFGLAHVSPHLRKLLQNYSLTDLIGQDNIHSNLRLAIESYGKRSVSKADRIRSLHLAEGEYVVIGGAVLELRGIRETNDIDIVVSREVYARLKSDGWKEFVHDDGKRLLTHKGYRIMQQWMGRDLDDFARRAEAIDGIMTMALDDLRDCKSLLGRRKDLSDITLIQKYCRQQSRAVRREKVTARAKAIA